MASRPIIKHLNILEYFCSRCFTGFKDVAAYFLFLQATEEGLDHRVIITVPSDDRILVGTEMWDEPDEFLDGTLDSTITTAIAYINSLPESAFPSPGFQASIWVAWNESGDKIGDVFWVTTSINPVPAPSAFLLFGTGLAGLVAWRYRKGVKA